MSTMHTALHPQHPPVIRRRLAFGPEHWAGLVLLLAIPLLAVFGFLGDKEATLETSGGNFVLRASSPVIAREGERVRLKASLVATESSSGVSPVRFFVTRDYLDRFENVVSEPVISEKTSSEAEISPGNATNSAAWEINFEGNPFRRGKVEGSLGVVFSDGSRLTLPLKTFVLP